MHTLLSSSQDFKREIDNSSAHKQKSGFDDEGRRALDAFIIAY